MKRWHLTAIQFFVEFDDIFSQYDRVRQCNRHCNHIYTLFKQVSCCTLEERERAWYSLFFTQSKTSIKSSMEEKSKKWNGDNNSNFEFDDIILSKYDRVRQCNRHCGHILCQQVSRWTYRVRFSSSPFLNFYYPRVAKVRSFRGGASVDDGRCSCVWKDSRGKKGKWL